MARHLSQGGRANSNGRNAERIIESALYQYAPHAEIVPQALLGKSLFGGDLKIDLYVCGLATFPNGLAVESKWQESSGTADEKLTYLVANIKACYPCPAIIVAGGGGARPSAIRWLKEQVDGTSLIAVLNIEEFMKWCSRNL